ncbi:hypothetical protein CFC21_098664 [Triticum aestivum]|uniref:Uncharacterized protein n=3 Tax=Triticum TaxID=4564 RepID=A0A9R0ZIJ2_TRITD|nr:hypothetical protein CFC21_098664 [Triticum aestivum]VAI77569.1 unnamed protein product [Triticum turgidum subsp. durum]
MGMGGIPACHIHQPEAFKRCTEQVIDSHTDLNTILLKQYDGGLQFDALLKIMLKSQEAGALPEEFVGADVVSCGRRRWLTVAGRRRSNSGLAAPTSDCSVRLNGDIEESLNGDVEERHRD